MKQIIDYLNKAIKKQRFLVIFIVVIFIIGLIMGSLFINFVSNEDKKMLVEQITGFFLSIKKLSPDVFGIGVFKENLINNILQLLIIFILGISMIGVVAVIIIIFFKGFTLGVTLSSIIVKYQIKGILGSLLYLFPCYLFNIFIYIFICFFATNASIKFLKALLKKDNLNFKSFLGKYLLSFIISIILIIIYCVLDAFLSPLLLKLFTYIT